MPPRLKVFQAHLGFFDPLDTLALVGALEQVSAHTLRVKGFALGDALTAAQKEFAKRTQAAKSSASAAAGPASLETVAAGR